MSRVKIKMIVAISEDGIVGKPDGSLPFKQKSDLLRFKELTLNHPVVLGRKTFDSLPFVLPGRDHFVLSRSFESFQRSCHIKKCNYGVGARLQHLPSMQDLQSLAMKKATQSDCDYSTIWIIGGPEVYKEALEHLHIDSIEVTLVHTTFPNADATWARMCLPNSWEEVDQVSYGADANNEHPYSFITLKRKQ